MSTYLMDVYLKAKIPKLYSIQTAKMTVHFMVSFNMNCEF